MTTQTKGGHTPEIQIRRPPHGVGAFEIMFDGEWFNVLTSFGTGLDTRKIAQNHVNDLSTAFNALRERAFVLMESAPALLEALEGFVCDGGGGPCPNTVTCYLHDPDGEFRAAVDRTGTAHARLLANARQAIAEARGHE